MSPEGGGASDVDPLRKRLLYLAHHRGFKEADLLIGRFAKAHLPAMAPAELAAFESLLQHSDHAICDLIVGQGPPPAGIDAGLIARMRAFARSGGAVPR